MLREDAPRPVSEPENSYRPSESAAGRILYERFLVARELNDPSGSGRFRCCIATDLKNFCRPVVLKVLDEPSELVALDSPSYQQLCEVLVHLDHPRIEQVVEAGKLRDGRPYSLSTLIEGERLSSILQGGKRLDLEQTARIVEAVYEALAAAHSKNVLHCDVNPENVVISDGGTDGEYVRLINFGVAWPVDLRGEMRRPAANDIHPIHYTAPELLVRLSHRSPASDIYSLAAMAYRMLVGRVPFGYRDREQLLAKITSGEIDPPSELRTDVRLETDRVILAGLGSESAWRPQDIEDFGSRLVLSLREKPVITIPSRTTAVVAEMKAKEPAVFIDKAEPVSEPIDTMPQLRRRSSAQSALSDRSIIMSLMVLLLGGALSIPIGQIFLNEGTKVSATGTMLARKPESSAKRKLRYMAESVAGTQQLTVEADTPGDLYVLNEFSTDGSPFQFGTVVPTTNAAASIEAGKPVKSILPPTKPNETVKAVWLIWTGIKNEDLEVLRNLPPGQAASDETTRKIRHFLERNRDLRVEADRDELTGHTVLTGVGDRLVHRINVDPK